VYSKPQKLATEFFGTFVVVLACVGAVCGNQFVLGDHRVVLGFHQALNGSAAAGAVGFGPFGVALAYGVAFAVMTAAVGRISGGHFNPAISVGSWAVQRLSSFDAVSYCVVQLGGATLAAYLLGFVIPQPIWRAAALGTPDLASGVTRGPAMLVEGLGTLVVAFAVYVSTYAQKRGGSMLGAIASGTAVTAATYFAEPFTGGSLNPARAFGPALVSAHWTDQGVYWIGPLAGGALAAWTCSLLFTRAQQCEAQSQTTTPPAYNH